DNNHVSNLRWGDVKDNVRDAIRNQKHPGAAIACPKGHPYRDGPSSGKRRRCSSCELERDYPKATPGTAVTAVIARVAGGFVAQTLTRGIKRIITSVERNKMPFVLSLDTGISSGIA